MASLTSTGYVLQTQNEWFSQERQFYLDIDPLWNLDPSTPDGLKMANDAEIFYILDETLQQAYNSKDPNRPRATTLISSARSLEPFAPADPRQTRR